MSGLTIAALWLLSPAQDERRPVLAVVGMDALGVTISAEWRPLERRSGEPYEQFQWEARDADARLIRRGSTDTTAITFKINRPAAGQTIEIRLFVRGMGPGPGPWGWASHPLEVSTEPTDPVAEPIRESTGEPPPEPAPVVVAVQPPEPEPEPPAPVPEPEPEPQPEPDPETVLPTPETPGGNHEPPGFRPLLTAEALTAIASAPNARAVTAADAPLPSGVVEIAYPAEHAGGDATVDVSLVGPPATATELYVRYAFKPARGFTGHPSAVNRILEFSLGDNVIYDMISGAGGSPVQYQIGLDGPRPACQLSKRAPRAQRLVPNADPLLFARDRWYVVEIIIRPGTPGACDGSVHVWLNEVAVMVYDDIGLGRTGGSPLVLTGVRLRTVWGDEGSMVQLPFSLYLNGIRVSGAN